MTMEIVTKILPAKLSKKLGKNRETAMFYVIMFPFIIMLLCIKTFPFFWGLYISVTNYSGFNIDRLKFVGARNYLRVLSDYEALPSLGRTFIIGLITVPITIMICNILAILLSNNIKGIGVYRTIYYLPSIVPVVTVGMMWQSIFLKDGGLFNALLGYLGIQPINWLGYDWARTSLIIMLLWGAGGGVLGNLAAIKAVPRELMEAAEIDGANYFQRIFKITLPLISNMNYLNLVTGIIGMLQLFGQPVLLSGTAMTTVPIRPIYTYLVHVYQQIFANLRFGYGLSMVWIVFVIIVSLTFVTDKTSKYWVHYEI